VSGVLGCDGAHVSDDCVLGCAGVCWGVLGCAEVTWGVLGCAGCAWSHISDVLGCAGVNWCGVLGCAEVCWECKGRLLWTEAAVRAHLSFC
jgi:hypothetical protein